jgi:predicted RNase H-like HicB family nuclease
MKQLKIIIGRSKHNYGARSENAPGIYGEGDTVEEAKQSILDAIASYKENSPVNAPSILKGECELVFKFDAQSFLNYYLISNLLNGLHRPVIRCTGQHGIVHPFHFFVVFQRMIKIQFAVIE